MCNFACKGRPRNDQYCVGLDVKPYSLIHSLLGVHFRSSTDVYNDVE